MHREKRVTSHSSEKQKKTEKKVQKECFILPFLEIKYSLKMLQTKSINMFLMVLKYTEVGFFYSRFFTYFMKFDYDECFHSFLRKFYI